MSPASIPAHTDLNRDFHTRLAHRLVSGCKLYMLQASHNAFLQLTQARRRSPKSMRCTFFALQDCLCSKRDALESTNSSHNNQTHHTVSGTMPALTYLQVDQATAVQAHLPVLPSKGRSGYGSSGLVGCSCSYVLVKEDLREAKQRKSTSQVSAIQKRVRVSYLK